MNTAIAGIELEKMAEKQVTLLGWGNDGTAESNDIKKSFIAGYKAALLLQQKPNSDKIILIEKIAEQEIEIASLKSKVKELQSDYMAVQTENQSNESK